MSVNFTKLGLAAAGMLAATTAITPAADAAVRVRFECQAFGASDISMHARYEIRDARRKFSAEFEAAPDLGFAAGQRLGVNVKGVRVGTMLLEKIVGGDVVGDLNFDTRPQPPDSVAFPANWPANVGRGTVVRIFKGPTSVLGCALR